MNESSLAPCQAKEQNPTRRQRVVVALVGQKVQAFVDTANDLNLIRKDTAEHLFLQPLCPARAETQAGGILLKTYSVFHEQLQITESFGAHLDA